MIRPYQPTDKDDCIRIMGEVGWLEGKPTDSTVFDSYISDSSSFVTELHGDAEVLVLTRPGQVLVQNKDIQMSVVMGVLASRVARMQGHALKTTALAIMNSAENGAAVSFWVFLTRATMTNLALEHLDITELLQLILQN